jgi:hypothetical protein
VADAWETIIGDGTPCPIEFSPEERAEIEEESSAFGEFDPNPEIRNEVRTSS